MSCRLSEYSFSLIQSHRKSFLESNMSSDRLLVSWYRQVISLFINRVFKNRLGPRGTPFVFPKKVLFWKLFGTEIVGIKSFVAKWQVKKSHSYSS